MIFDLLYVTFIWVTAGFIACVILIHLIPILRKFLKF